MPEPEQPEIEIMMAPLSSRMAHVAAVPGRPGPITVPVYQNQNNDFIDSAPPRANRALFEFFQKELLQVWIPSTTSATATASSSPPAEYYRHRHCYCSIIQDNAPASISIPQEETQDQDGEEETSSECPHKGKHKLCPLVWSNNAYTSAHRYMLEQQLLAACRWESYAKMDQKSLSLPPRRAPLTEYEQQHQDCNVCHSHRHHHDDDHGENDGDDGENDEQQQEKEKQASSTCPKKSCTAPKAPRRSRSPPPSPPPLSPSSSCCESNHYHQHYYQQKKAANCTDGNGNTTGGGSPKNSIARMA